jgi:hypothetical protein
MMIILYLILDVLAIMSCIESATLIKFYSSFPGCSEKQRERERERAPD